MRYIATRSFHHNDGKGNVTGIVRDLDILDGRHELVRLYPDNFAPLDEPEKPDVEDATAAPGRKRGQK